jgi:hypothetical protein
VQLKADRRESVNPSPADSGAAAYSARRSFWVILSILANVYVLRE